MSQQQCTHTIPITAAVETVYTLCAQNLTGLSRVSMSACATTRFEAQHPHRAD
ncbi:hypothetical protein V5P93_005259 [Actinokineospora auranticolor]|uniref:Uncharacterized protein n=1 Tax=Actinokineospora auranticolor TaxID=155976 RepID=A0A2S6GD01_9PSEU|nr:hypothetical protein [Actinokineospora auranticolor]PPK63115.1 hypothetical protein CLV40_13248 [Actinokineospora auranticolor]